MKRFFKCLFSIVLVVFFVVSVAACTQTDPKKTPEQTATPTTEEPTETSDSDISTNPIETPEPLSDEEIKANFSEEIAKVSVSKAAINALIQSVVSQSDGVDLGELFDLINIPTTNLHITNVPLEGKSQEVDIYAWQKGDKIFLGHASFPDQVLFVDLARIEEEASALIPELPTDDVDYVGLLLSLVEAAPDFDIDQYLSKIKFVLDDFTYEDGVFTFSKEALVDKIAEVLLVPTDSVDAFKEQLALAIKEFSLEIAYDGYHFTEFDFAISLNPEMLNSASVDVAANLKLVYVGDSLVGIEVAANFTQNVPNTLAVEHDVKFSASAAGIKFVYEAGVKEDDVNGDYEYHFNSQCKFDLSIDLLKSTLNFEVTAISTYSYSSGDYSDESSQKAVCTLSLSQKGLELKLVYNDVEAVKATLTVVDSKLAGEIKIVVSAFEEDGYTDYVLIELDTNAEVPADILANEATATDVTGDLISMISEAIGGSTNVPAEPEITDGVNK